jgi:hypothetical protein
MTALDTARLTVAEIEKVSNWTYCKTRPTTHLYKAHAAAMQTIAALTVYQEFIGVCAYRPTDLDLIASLGVKHVRMDNPSAATIDLARSKGLEVLPIADYNPWTDTRPAGASSDKYLPDTDAKRQLWAQRMVAQWAGMASPPKVLEVWNEPWLTGFSEDGINAASYLALVKAFAAEAWKVWPGATILVASDTMGTDSYPWRQNLLAADTGQFLTDPRVLPTTHNYIEGRTPTQVTASPCAWDLDRYKCAYTDWKAHGHADPQVWVTEFGWESGVVGEANQAAYTRQAFQSFKSSGMVAAAFTFFLKSNDAWSYNWLRTDNTQKPVTAAVKEMLV